MIVSDAVRRWLDDRGVATQGPVTANLIAGGRSNPTYEVTDGDRSWVLRRPPTGHVLATAHDMGREVRVLTALRDSAVPVPTVVGFCEDDSVIGAPFYVMERLDGITLRTAEDTARLDESQRAAVADALVDTLVALHGIGPGDVGLADWGRPDGFLERQLRRWRAQWHASATRERPQVDRLLDRLADTMPGAGLPGIVHGDFKIDNVMVAREDPTRIIGLLDWEMSTLGDTLTDLGILVSFWDEAGEPLNPITAGATALPGFPTREGVIARYAERRGIDTDDLAWYVVFADVKVAVILEGIHARHAQGHTAGSDFEGLDAAVDQLLQRAVDLADHTRRESA